MTSFHTPTVAPAPTPEQSLEDRIAAAGRLLRPDPQAARLAADEAVQLAQSMHAVHAYARALCIRAGATGMCGNTDDARDDFIVALSLAESYSDRRLVGQCLHGIATTHLYCGDLAAGLEHAYRALAVRREVGDQAGLLVSLVTLGAILGELGSFADAAECFIETLTLARALGDRHGEAMTLANIGEIKIDCGEPEAAIPYLTQSLALTHEIGVRIDLPNVFTLLATAYRRLGRLPEARDAAQTAVDISLETGSLTIPKALSTLGMVQADMGDLTGAEESLHRAERAAGEKETGLFTADLRLNLGLIYTRIGEFTRAREAFEAGLAHVDQESRQNYASRLHLALAQMYAAQGDYRSAFESQCRFIEIDRAFQKQQAQNLLIAQLSRLEAERARQEAEIQRLKMIELAATNRRNEALLEQMQQHAEQMTQLATTDPLTGLYNRRYLHEFVRQEIVRTPCCSVAIADLDNFKRVNDRFGHQIGDQVLKIVARLLATSVRRSDVVARHGGEEFVVVFPNLVRSEAAVICERIRVAIAEHDWSEVHPELEVTTSIGLSDTAASMGGFAAYLNATASETTREVAVEQLFTLADRRLYLAKELGKNRIA
jgi:diguanylate cyclase (GGDEF)-like protein